jgi:hypothetical protein
MGHVAHMGEMRVHMTFWFKILKRRDHFEDLHGRTIGQY